MSPIIISKQQILKRLDTFPDKVVIEDLIENIMITVKIEIARQQVRNGEFLTEEELDKEVDSWN